MAKQKKKRNKSYTGTDAAISRPVITRISAANRSKFGQWWFEHKRIARPLLITSGIIAILVWLTVELIRIASGS
ncbi:MAG TPA: hypothetical protein VFS65_02450 [Candidatus Saccharimonadales bacterium]|nr:hypothetical protein [Candidatus Saccharimonadales bacterium]